MYSVEEAEMLYGLG